MDQTTSDFITLFSGRWDAYGDASENPRAVKTDLTNMHWERHLLNTDRPIGIYPLTDSHKVRWGCSDFDTGEVAVTEARNIQSVFRHFGVTTWVEISRRKGAHLWLFASEPVPAETMRTAFLAAHQIADIAAIEVNPKQVTLNADKKLGNWVRLPYPGGMKTTPERQVVIDSNDHPIPIEIFVQDARSQRSNEEDLLKVGSLYSAPGVERETLEVGQWEGDIELLRKKLGGLSNTIFCNGPLKARDGKAGRDRSSTLSRLAWLIASEGEMSPTEAFVVLKDADKRWGKFYERPDCDDQLHRILEWAWAQ